MDQSKTIRTVDDLVAAFGGTFAFAEWVDVVPSSVSNWKAAGAIPNGYHLRIYLELKRRGLDFEVTVFNIDPSVLEPPEAQAVA